jgi:hypothetical protein
MGMDFGPELDAEPVEVRADGTRVGVATIQAAVQEKCTAKHGSQDGWGDSPHEIFYTFRVKIPAEPLKLRRQQHRVGVVDLLDCISAAWSRAADAPVGGLDFIEFRGPGCVPFSPRMRWHRR